VRLKALLIWRLGIVGVITAMGLLAAVPAYAAPPGNDTIGGSVTIGALPYTTTQDTTEAASDAVDVEANANCGAPALDATVWYSVTPTTDTVLVVDVSDSAYAAGVLVVTGQPGNLELVACGPGAVAFEATAGTTYQLLVIDYDGVGNGGTLVLHVEETSPPPEIDVTVNRTALYHPRTGTVTVSGTIICSGDVESTFLFTDLVQRVGPGAVAGSGYTEAITCDGTVQQWSVEVVPYLGQKFIGGRSASFTVAVACAEYFCGEDFEEQTVIISRR
jgi:hypothetical protein